jgi:uncharacterized protein YajQ (UPF0234 family)
MHNNKGFKKEIEQLKLTLKECKRECGFLFNEIRAIKIEFTTFSGDANFELSDLNHLLAAKYEQVDQNREQLRVSIYARVDMNNNIFELTKRMKVIEGKTIILTSQNLKSQKHHLTKQLRKLLQQIENKPHQRLDSESLRIQVQQQERLRIVLHSLMVEFKDKIAYIQNTAYQQSVREKSYSPIPNYNRREYAKPEPQFTRSMQDFSPISSMSN